jgi:hypothetical protein
VVDDMPMMGRCPIPVVYKPVFFISSRKLPQRSGGVLWVVYCVKRQPALDDHAMQKHQRV